MVRSYGIPEKFAGIFRNIYHQSSCCLRTDQGITNFFSVATGVRQECVLSPFLFLLAMDFVMRRSLTHGDYGLYQRVETRLADLDFADDIAPLGSTQGALRDHNAALTQEAARIGLRVNASKSKVLRVGYAGVNEPFEVDDEQLAEVGRFSEARVVVTNGSSDENAVCWIGKRAPCED